MISRSDYERLIKRCEMLMMVEPAPDSIYGKQIQEMFALIGRYERQQIMEINKSIEEQEAANGSSG